MAGQFLVGAGHRFQFSETRSAKIRLTRVSHRAEKPFPINWDGKTR